MASYSVFKKYITYLAFHFLPPTSVTGGKKLITNYFGGLNNQEDNSNNTRIIVVVIGLLILSQISIGWSFSFSSYYAN